MGLFAAGFFKGALLWFHNQSPGQLHKFPLWTSLPLSQVCLYIETAKNSLILSLFASTGPIVLPMHKCINITQQGPLNHNALLHTFFFFYQATQTHCISNMSSQTLILGSLPGKLVHCERLSQCFQIFAALTE